MVNFEDIMRVSFGHYWERFVSEKQAAPEYMKPPTFDPNFGFDEPRPVREMVATEAELEAANLRMFQRDYCAHLLIDVKKCMRDNRPCYWRCKHAKHAYLECQYEDANLRAKEYERERRLKLRQLTLEGKDGNGNPISSTA